MKYNKFILFLCFFILFLSLSTISASTYDNTGPLNDINNITTKNIGSNPVKESQDNLIYVDSSSESDREEGSKNFPYKSLNNENLERISANSTVYVSKGTYNINSSIINKDISIIGENQKEVIFIPNESSSAFNIGKNVNVLFKNFTLKDFSSDSSAAITNDGNLRIEDMTLLNNVGTTTLNKGGSILNNGKLEVINATFEKNKASYGSSIYNTANVTVINSSFVDNSIYNVGGAIYNFRANLTVIDSYFTLNRAVSGAAIYNAFGNLYVNNTLFKENSAEHFFGGAIYSTGFATTENCVFDSNFANIDGGAITNTNNFTIINSTFIENIAAENGGAIENVPWSENENGNLTIINSTFTGNYARKGGVIINYGKKDSVGEMATVTARNTLFESNSADKGGVVYNEQYVDFENCVFVDNEADEFNVVYSEDDLIKSLNNNWWGTNNPSIEEIGIMPKTWFILDFTNTSSLITDNNVSLMVSLNRLNTGETLLTDLPQRTAVFSAEKSVFHENEITFKNKTENMVKYYGDDLFVNVDYQQLKIPLAEATDTLLSLNPISDIKYNQDYNISGKLTDNEYNPLYNTTVNIFINNKRVDVKTNNEGEFSLKTKSGIMGLNNITVTFRGNVYYNNNSITTSFNVVKWNVSLYMDSIADVNYGNDVTISGMLKDDEFNALYNTAVKVNLDGKNITIRTDSEGHFFLYTKVTQMGKNNVTVVYVGNMYYNNNSVTASFNVIKQGVIIGVDKISDVAYGDSTIISGKITDLDGSELYNTHVDIRVNGRLFRTKTDSKGFFNLTLKSTTMGANTVYVVYDGNDYYSSNITEARFKTVKQNVEFIVDTIGNISYGDNVKIAGKLVDGGNNILYNTNIQIKINDNLFKLKTNLEGMFSLTTDNVLIGNNSVIFSYGGNEYFNANSTSSYFVVKS